MLTEETATYNVIFAPNKLHLQWEFLDDLNGNFGAIAHQLDEAQEGHPMGTSVHSHCGFQLDVIDLCDNFSLRPKEETVVFNISVPTLLLGSGIFLNFQ